LYGAGSQAEMTARRIFPRVDQEEQRQELIQHIRHTNPDVYKNAMHELGLFDVRKKLIQIELPALIITGEKDTTVPLENQLDLVKGLRGSQQIMIPDAGHGAIIDSPDTVNNALIRFISQHSI
jgi:3-oxoadipate enol-lactonase